MGEAFPWQEAPNADFCVIGDPVEHSRSPEMHMAAFEVLGLPYRYVRVHVPKGEASQALEHLRDRGYVGVNATVPHKEAAFEWAEEPDARSSRIRAANTLRLGTREATNTDGPGFLYTLNGLGLPRGARVLILGAGGSARSVAAALSDAGFNLAIWNRSPERVFRLLAETGVPAAVEDSPTLLGVRLVVNTTSVGLHGDRLPLDWSRCDPELVAYDLVYGNTPFLDQARALGLRTRDGTELLVAQGALSLE
ncbi:MAG TPA: shikimate dehydrogenase, partial [Fimbriimonadaceae bacterium]|nr:shikimate dehydrogenase [Fimbriimonadaceae bacterium]